MMDVSRITRVLTATALAAVVIFVAAGSPAAAATSDSVEETSRRIANLAQVRDELIGRLELAARTTGEAPGKAARRSVLQGWIDDLNGLIAAEDGRLAAAMSAGDRLGPLPAEVERWRGAIASLFPPHRVNEALLVIACESEGDPAARNRRSGAAGLFQFLRGTWRHVADRAGLDGAERDDPLASIRAAAWLVADSEASGIGPWAHWSCRP